MNGHVRCQPPSRLFNEPDAAGAKPSIDALQFGQSSVTEAGTGRGSASQGE
jgi:hypothetical protein